MGKLPALNHFLKSFMFLACERFGQYISPVEICVNFDEFDVTIFDLVMKVMPFYGYVFRPGFDTFTICKNNAGCIVLKNHGGGESLCSSGIENSLQWNL